MRALSLWIYFEIAYIFYFIWVEVILFLLICVYFAFIICLSHLSSNLTAIISGSSVSTIPTRNIFGNTFYVEVDVLFSSVIPSLLKLMLWLGHVVVNPSRYNLFVIWSIAALEGAHTIIFFLYSDVHTLFRY